MRVIHISKNLILFVALSIVLILVVWQSISSNIPSITSPWPIWLMLLMWLFYPKYFVILLPVLLMWIWHKGLPQNKAMIPKRSWLLFYCLIVLSLLYFVLNIYSGIEHQGKYYVITILVINVVVVSINVQIGLKARKMPGYRLNVIFDWILFAWSASYAFPYFGQMPY